MIAVLLSALALVVAGVALAYAITARRDARVAVEAVRTLASRRRPDPPEAREVNLGPARSTGERRQRDDGPGARHRDPTDARARRGDLDEWPPAEPAPVEEAETTTIPAVRTPGRRPPPPLPRPGQIERPR